MYGGAFNPPHTGHMAFAAAARDCLDLDALYIVPTGEPPHKPMPDGSPDADRRLELARMAFEGLPRVEVSDCEIARGGVSYTADTVRRFSGEHPGATVYLITGTDMFLTLRNWKDAGSILETVVPAVGARRGGDAPKIRETAEIMRRELGVAPEIIEFEPVEMSSSRLRDALRAGEGKEYLAEGVYACIIRNGFYGARPELGWLRERAYAMLDDARVAHVAGCEREAALLAGRWGEDERSAREAAILHDVTKRLDAVEQMELCERYGICVDDVEREYTKLLHSKTGAAVARAEFCVSDAVYNAIMWHTTGRAGMTMLDKIIYIADYIEPTRDFEETARLKQLAYSDIDAAVEYGLEISIEDVTSRGAAPHPRSLEALRFLREAQP
ncbi:MAG: nicotinate (nicotinamide) nucleotide adenylyltransferase [Oscillospiraceae bacterium]|nr:nicotinate (nicotinamide) nucleotide adenylyltransferase [Oscillospiraceae bacterium]